MKKSKEKRKKLKTQTPRTEPNLFKVSTSFSSTEKAKGDNDTLLHTQSPGINRHLTFFMGKKGDTT